MKSMGIKISEFKTTLESVSNDPNNTGVCVGEPDSIESENKHLSECEITQLGSSSNGPHNAAVCVGEPDNKRLSECGIAQLGSSSNEPHNPYVCVSEPDSYESENKRPRLSAERVNHAQNGAQSLVQNVLSSQVHPDQNNMLPQHFNIREGPIYCGNCGYWGYSSCLRRSNLAPPQCFNKWGEPFNPVYVPSAPGLNMHSYSNYQSLWQQPSLSEQRTAPSGAFVPYEAPRPCFTYWSGANYHGNVPQSPSGNSYSYIAHSGNGNYNQ